MKNYQADIALLSDPRYAGKPKPGNWYHENMLKDDEPLMEELQKRGYSSVRISWDEKNVDWSIFKCVVFRTTWDYFERYDQFSVWLEKVNKLTKLCNPLHIIKWNVDKHYLVDLEKQGIPIVPSRFLEAGSGEQIIQILEEMNWSEGVIKPCIAGGARLTYRINKENCEHVQQELQKWLDAEAFIIQPFMSHVMEVGEDTLMVMNGTYTHAIRKVAKPGDFRVQDDYGGTVHKLDPTPEQMELAEKTMAACGELLAYGRVDMVKDNNGNWVLMELEVIEPELWIRFDTASASPFADGIVRLIEANH